MARLRFLPIENEEPHRRRLAATYVRMSTEMQRYSIEHQEKALAAYAAAHDITIVQTYADRGKSGLSLKGRPALRALLDDVALGPEFEILLVYDVSRWGRFQDVDESAFYEFQCRRAGVHVIYCEEPFNDDRSAMGAVYKTIKRAMAGEFSRELSAKVSRGQRNLSAKGYWQGGPAGFGMRRVAVDQQGKILGPLDRGQHKFSRGDKTILEPGDPAEVATIREVFRLYCEGYDRAAITRHMNATGTPSTRGGKWWPSHVRHILMSERYIGHYVYGRSSQRLQSPVRPTPVETHVRAENVFAPIVDPETFALAQRIRLARSGAMTKEQMVERLKVLLARHGKLTRLIIEADLETPSPTLYVSRFGDIVAAYEAAGWRSPMNLEAKIAGARLAAARRKRFNAACREAAAAGLPAPAYEGRRSNAPGKPALRAEGESERHCGEAGALRSHVGGLEAAD